MGGYPVIIDMHDAPENSRYHQNIVTDEHIFKAGIIFICFNVANKVSWVNVKWYKNDILRIKGNGTDYIVVLVSTKGDLEKVRAVPRKNIFKKARKWNVPLIEISAKEYANVDFLCKQSIHAYWVNSTVNCMTLNVD